MTSVELQRTIPASPARDYRAWLDPELLLRWAAPVEYEAARVEVDERVGGHYRCWHVDAQRRDVGGFDCEILELVPDERIVLRWQFVELTLVHDRLDGLERRLPGMTDATHRGWSGTIIRPERTVRAGS